MLPEYVEVEPDVFQPYSDATVAGWRNEQRLATQQGKHQRAGVTQMVLLADKLQIAETCPCTVPPGGVLLRRGRPIGRTARIAVVEDFAIGRGGYIRRTRRHNDVWALGVLAGFPPLSGIWLE